MAVGGGGGETLRVSGRCDIFYQASVKVILCVVGLHKLDKRHEKAIIGSNLLTNITVIAYISAGN